MRTVLTSRLVFSPPTFFLSRTLRYYVSVEKLSIDTILLFILCHGFGFMWSADVMQAGTFWTKKTLRKCESLLRSSRIVEFSSLLSFCTVRITSAQQHSESVHHFCHGTTLSSNNFVDMVLIFIWRIHFENDHIRYFKLLQEPEDTPAAPGDIKNFDFNE